MRRPVSTPRGLETTQTAMEGRVVWRSVLPNAPQDPDPRSSERSDRVRVILTSGDRIEVLQ